MEELLNVVLPMNFPIPDTLQRAIGETDRALVLAAAGAMRIEGGIGDGNAELPQIDFCGPRSAVPIAAQMYQRADGFRAVVIRDGLWLHGFRVNDFVARLANADNFAALRAQLFGGRQPSHILILRDPASVVRLGSECCSDGDQ